MASVGSGAPATQALTRDGAWSRAYPRGSRLSRTRRRPCESARLHCPLDMIHHAMWGTLRKIVPTVLPITAACALVAGCGGGITKARAVAFARAVNLRVSDAPGMSVHGRERERPALPKAARALEAALSRCEGVHPATRVASIHSISLARGRKRQEESFVSMVEVLPTAALAAQTLAAERPSRQAACADRVFGEPERADIKSVPVSPLPGVLTSYEEQASVRLPRTAVSSGYRLYLDVLGFRWGSAVILLDAQRLDHPPSSSEAHRLLSLLYSRAKTHTL
jgi:hypothetical protein